MTTVGTTSTAAPLFSLDSIKDRPTVVSNKCRWGKSDGTHCSISITSNPKSKFYVLSVTRLDLLQKPRNRKRETLSFSNLRWSQQRSNIEKNTFLKKNWNFDPNLEEAFTKWSQYCCFYEALVDLCKKSTVRVPGFPWAS